MTHPLCGALSVVLPDAGQTLLVRACVAPDRAGREALESWLALQDGSMREFTGQSTRWLLPLLLEAVQTHSVEADPALLTILKTAALREELRTRTFRAICKGVLAALVEAGCRAIALKGTALGESVYARPMLRHSHDIEILVPEAGLIDVGASLAPLGFSASSRRAVTADAVELTHDSGLPLVLRRALFEVPFYNALVAAACARAESIEFMDTRMQVLSPADALLHACGHAFHSPARGSQRWIVDAWYLIDKRRDLDWEVLLRTAAEAHLRLPLATLLGYLARELAAPIPPDVLARAAASAAAAAPVDGELALLGARSTGPGGFRTLLRRERSMAGRVRILRWMLAPSRAYLSWVAQQPDPWLLPAQYVMRPARYLSRRVSSS